MQLLQDPDGQYVQTLGGSPAAPATAEELQDELTKFRRWLRDRWDTHRAKLAAAEFPDHPDADYDRHCSQLCHRVCAQLVWQGLAPAAWLLPEDPEAQPSAATTAQDICHGQEVPTP